jgi:hypothetical protein
MGVEFLEQPLPDSAAREWGAKALALPVMADESCVTEADLDRLWRIKDLRRAQRRLARPWHRPDGGGHRVEAGRHGAGGACGIVRVLRRKAKDALCPKSRGETVGEIGHLILLGGAAIEAGLERGECFGCKQRQADEIEAEAGVDRIGKTVETFAEQAEHNGGIAHRPAGLDQDAAHGSIGAKEAGLEQASAFSALAEARAGFLRQFRQRRHEGALHNKNGQVDERERAISVGDQRRDDDGIDRRQVVRLKVGTRRS